jgi:hypothetical protein
VWRAARCLAVLGDVAESGVEEDENDCDNYNNAASDIGGAGCVDTQTATPAAGVNRDESRDTMASDNETRNRLHSPASQPLGAEDGGAGLWAQATARHA